MDGAVWKVLFLVIYGSLMFITWRFVLWVAHMMSTPVLAVVCVGLMATGVVILVREYRRDGWGRRPKNKVD